MSRKARILQTNFAAGEFDPLLASRTDTKQYYQSAEYLRNVLALPQGGVKRRPGLQHMCRLAIETLPAVRFIPFQYSTTQRYLLLATVENITVFKDGIYQADIPIPHTEAQLLEMTWTQSLDTLLLFHPDVQFQKIQRQGTDVDWAIEPLVAANPPTYFFERDTGSTGTPSAKTGSSVTFTAGASEFTAGDVGKTIRGNAGVAKITAYSSETSVTISISTDFLNTNAIAAGSWTVEESAWSDARGWPSCGTFHQGRLWLAGSRQMPQSCWGSRSNSYFDFDTSQTLDDFGIAMTADADTVSAIAQLYSGRYLQAFTSDSEWYIPVSSDTITPENAWLKRATKRGMKTEDADGTKRRLAIAEADGAVIFVQSGGKAVREFVWDEAQQDFRCDPISLLSSHLLNDPVDFAIRKATSTEDADFVIVVNYDGTLAILCTLRDQSVTSWTGSSTRGLFKGVGIDGNWIYFAVQREIDGDQVLDLERFNSAYLLDGSIKASADPAVSTFSGFGDLGSESVTVYADEEHRGTFTADSGDVTIDCEAYEMEAGFDFPTMLVDDVEKRTPYIRTQRVEPNLPDGTAVGILKRIIEARLVLNATQNVTVNGEDASFDNFDEAMFDDPPKTFTGVYAAQGLLGWDEDGQIEISQSAPGPFCLLGISLKVAI